MVFHGFKFFWGDLDGGYEGLKMYTGIAQVFNPLAILM